MIKPLSAYLLCACTVFFLGAAAESAAQASPRSYFARGTEYTEADLPASALRTKLESLPVQARAKALEHLKGFSYHANDIAHLRVSDEGGIYYVCDALAQPAPDKPTAREADRPTRAPVSVSSPPIYHSKPGSSKVIYLDFNGFTISGTAWNSGTNASVFVGKVYDTDGNPATFSDAEQAAIKGIWQRVAEDYAPWDVDVTTEEPSVWDNNKGRCLVTASIDATGKNMPAANAGGVAYVNVFGGSSYLSYYQPAFVYFDNLSGGQEDVVAEACSHEMGHNMGLSHDGNSGKAYYPGHGSGDTSWAPIMGGSYGENVSQWCKGDYYDANQTQDDLSIIDGKLTYRADDVGNDNGSAAAMIVSGTSISSTNNKGVIEKNTDTDVWSFTTGAGAIDLYVFPWTNQYNTKGGNLDVKLTLYNSGGGTVATDDNASRTYGRINTSVSAGTYYLHITGVGFGTPLSNPPEGYTSYGSIGQYHIRGSLQAANPSERYTELFSSGDFDLNNKTITYTPNGTNEYAHCIAAAGAFTEDPSGGSTATTNDDGNIRLLLTGWYVPMFGTSYTQLWVNSNGSITFGSGDNDSSETVAEHFAADHGPRVSGFWDDLNAAAGGSITYKVLGSGDSTRLAVTWDKVPKYNSSSKATFQVVLWKNGTINITWLGHELTDGLVGLGDGNNEPGGFLESNLGGYDACAASEPSVSVTSPLAGSDIVVNTSTGINVTASDSNGSVTGVWFYANGSFLSSDVSSPYNYTWAPSVIEAVGLTAVAWDNEGLANTSSTVNVNVVDPLPSVTVTGPVAGAGFQVDASIPVYAVASDNGSVTQVQFFSNGSLLGTDASSPYTVTWNNAGPAGSYNLTAVAWDNNGQAATSAAVNINVSGDAFTELFAANDFDLNNQTIEFTPDGSGYTTCIKPAGGFPTDPGGGTLTSTNDDSWTRVWFSGMTIKLFGNSYTQFYLASNGSVTFSNGDFSAAETLAKHFSDGTNEFGPRISCLWEDLNPAAAGSLTRKYITTEGQKRWAVTWQNVPHYTAGNGVANMQLEMWDSGLITMTYIGTTVSNGLVGLSAGQGIPSGFAESDISGYGGCSVSAPSVSITSPTGGASYVVGSNVTVNANASDTDGSITGVLFYANGSPIGGDNSSPYTLDWPAAGSGSVDLTAVAFDNSGLGETSSVVTIEVLANVPPSVSITGPTNAAGYLAGSSVDINVSASDGGSVTSVFFYLNGGLLGTDTSAAYSYAWDTAGDAGSNVLVAVAWDDGGLAATSSPVYVFVSDDFFTEHFTGTADLFDLDNTSLQFTPNGATNYSACLVSISSFPTDPSGSVAEELLDDGSAPVALPAGASVEIYGNVYSQLYVNSNGSITFTGGDNDYSESIEDHFAASHGPRVSILWDDLNPSTNGAGTISHKTITTPGEERTVVTFQGVIKYARTNSLSAQVELWKDGRITISYVGNTLTNGVVGLSAGAGVPAGFVESELAGYSACAALPPSVMITSPTNGAFFQDGSNVTIAADASDPDGSVTGVYFYAGAGLLGGDASAPYEQAWTASGGNVSLTAVAWDSQGLAKTSVVVNVSVNNNQPPSVSITSPTNNTVLEILNSINVDADASDVEGAITSVGFFENGSLINSTSSPPFSVSWTPMVLGSRALTAVATDDQGQVTTSAVVNVSVYTNLPPSISITTPTNGAVLVVGSNTLVAANASDSGGSVTAVLFYAEGSLLGTSTSLPYQAAYVPASVGAKSLSAAAFDNQGVATTSSVILVTVYDPLPSVTLTTPTNGAGFVLGADLGLAAEASDNDAVTQVVFLVDSTPVGIDVTAPFAMTWSNASPSGTRNVSAVAYDSAGQAVTSSVAAIDIGGDNLTEYFSSSDLDLLSKTLQLTPNGGGGYNACLKTAAGYPTDPTGSSVAVTNDDAFTVLTLSGGLSVEMFGVKKTNIFINSNGSLTFNAGDTDYSESIAEHFTNTFGPRISLLWHDLSPSAANPVTWKRVDAGTANDRIVVTWDNVPKYNSSDTVQMQAEVFTNGMLTVTWLNQTHKTGITGVSPGTGTPAGFSESDLSSLGNCTGDNPPSVSLLSPTNSQQVVLGSNVTLQASASDDSGVTQVVFYIDGSVVGTDVSAPYTASWSAMPTGTRTFTAAAWDDAGQTSLASAISIVVAGAGGGSPTGTHFAELFDAGDFDLDNKTLTFTPLGGAYQACVSAAGSFPTDPTGGTNLGLGDEATATVSLGGDSVSIYGNESTTLYVNDNGYITTQSVASDWSESLAEHFASGAGQRVSLLWHDLDPGSGGTVSWKATGSGSSRRIAITWQNVPKYNDSSAVNMQVELYTNGVITFTYVGTSVSNGLAGLSEGTGTPAGFTESDLSGLDACAAGDDPPTVGVLNPTNSQFVVEGSNLVVEASASDDVAVTGVVFYLDGVSLGWDTGMPYQQTAVAVTSGSRQVSAAAFDSSGQSVTSAVITFNVDLDTDNDGLGNGVDPDDDGDQMPDDFEAANALDPLNSGDASSDGDGDGQTAVEEWLAGTQVTNGNSYFKAMAISNLTGRAVYFATVTGKLYDVQYQDSLGDPSWNSLSNGISGNGGTVLVEDGSTNDVRHFRVRLRMP